MRSIALMSLAALVVTLFSSCGASPEQSKERPRVAYVTNGIASFWNIAAVGARQAGEDFDVDVEIRMPPSGSDSQKKMLEELLILGVDGIAVSPIDDENLTSFLNEVAAETILITQDSDAAESDRLCYIGMSNYDAGRMCGELIKEAIPDGGEVMICLGRLAQLNGRLRRQGIIDELLDRSHDPSRYDPPAGELKGDKYTVVGTRVDEFDMAKAKAQAEDAITVYPELKCMVGLFAYNPPVIVKAVHSAGRQDQIKVVGFDEDEATLQAIKDGDCHGTIVQNPYQYGYHSVKMLAALARDEPNAIPESKYVEYPARRVTQENVDEFWSELKEMLKKAESNSDE